MVNKKLLYYFYFSIVVILSISGNTFGQLPNFNMHLLANVNPHPGTGSPSTYSALWGYTASNGREYVILGCQSGTSFIDITDSSNMHEAAFLPGLNSNWREEKVIGHYAYIVSEAAGSGMQIVDLQYLPDSVHFVKNANFPNHSKTHTIQSYGRYLFLNGCNAEFIAGQGTVIIDCLDPVNPVVRGKASSTIGGNTNGYIHDCRIVNDTLYACNIYQGYVTAYDIRNKDSIKAFKSWQTNPNPLTHNCAFTTNRKYIFTTDETNSPNGKLKIWNVQDIMNPVFVTSWQPTDITTAIVHNVEVYGNYALVAHYTAGVRLLDISVPETPVEIAYYDTDPATNASLFNGCWAVYMFPSKKIAASDMATGLYVVKTNSTITNIGYNELNNIPTEYSLKQNFPNPFNPTTVIEFSIPENSNVKLKIFNSLGKEISELVNDRRDRGTYRVEFDGTRLASGIYFYSLITNDHSETRKMILIK